METDHYNTSDRARRAMLQAVYEENRRIVDHAGSVRRRTRRRRYAGGFVILAIGIVVVVALVATGDPGRRSSRSGDTVGTVHESTSPWAALVAAAGLPVVDTTSQDEAWLPEDEFRTLVEQQTPLAQLFGLNVRTIVIDAGHGGKDPGSVGPTGLVEKEVTLDVARRVERRLAARGYRVLMTRDEDRWMSLRDRVEFVNSTETDLFLSIHVNSFATDSVNVLETYYFGADDSERVLRAAEAENRDSDLSVADFDRLMGEVVTAVKLQESRRFARSIQRSLYRNVRREEGPISNWGTKPGPFVVLLGSRAPSVLAEIGVLSHPEGERRLASEAYRERLATYLEEGILNYLISRSRQDPGSETVN